LCKEQLQHLRVRICLVNTIMRAEMVTLCRELNLPVMWVIHEAWPRAEFEYYAHEVFMMKHLDREVIEKAFRQAQKIIFPSDVQMRLYEGLFKQNRARTIYNGIPYDKLREYRETTDRDKVRAELGYKPDDFVVVQIGTVCERKGQLTTAHAVKDMAKRLGGHVEKLRLLMVGARYIRDHEIKYIDEVKATLSSEPALDGKWTVLDVKKNVFPYYHAADVIVMPSKNEVLPLVICEAMAFRVPVIASKIDAIPEAMADGHEGFLIQAGNHGQLCDRLVQLYHDTELRECMGVKGHERIMDQFCFAKMTEKYRKELDHLHEVHHSSVVHEQNDDMEEEEEEQQRDDATEARDDDEEDLLASELEEEKEDLISPSTSFATLSTSASSVTLSTSPSALSLPRTLRSSGVVKSRRGRKQAVQRVLVDMDNTLVDWDSEFVRRWNQIYDQDISEHILNREHYEIEKNFDHKLAKKVLNVVASPGFYASLKPFRGAVDALREMVDNGIDVLLVTAPHPSCAARCAAEKFQWVSKHLGDDWHARLIIARDKTHVSGDYLIDDKPRITGSNQNPVWEQIIFDTSYNKDQVDERKRLSQWSEWRKIVLDDHH